MEFLYNLATSNSPALPLIMLSLLFAPVSFALLYSAFWDWYLEKWQADGVEPLSAEKLRQLRLAEKASRMVVWWVDFFKVSFGMKKSWDEISRE